MHKYTQMSVIHRIGSISCCLLFLLATTNLSAQFLADPNDDIYAHLAMWEQRGYVDQLPLIRPYPYQLVVPALEAVISQGDAASARLAERYLRRLKPDWLPFPLQASLVHDSQLKNETYQDKIGLDLISSGAVVDFLTYSVGGRLRLQTDPEGEVYPLWSTDYEQSIVNETMKYEVGDTYAINGVLTGGFAVGNENLYLQTGLLRSSFGSVYDSTVLGPQAHSAGHISATFRTSWLTLSTIFLDLLADYAVAPNGTRYLIKGNETYLYPSKYLILHSATFHIGEWINLGFIDSILFGGRITPIYIVPFFPVYAQFYWNDYDNSLIGFFARVRLPLNFQLDGLLYIDDFHTRKLLELSLDSNDNKVALSAGLSWIAPIAFTNRISFDYQMVTPYMYTHSSLQQMNYLQYTHDGEHLGSVLEPNSDQIALRIQFAPLHWLAFETWLKNIRHGNGSDYGDGSIDGDGSIWDDGYLSNGEATFVDAPSTFLTQEILEKVLQVGVTAEVAIDLWKTDTALSITYTFERVQNRDLDGNAPLESNHLLNVNVRVRI